ncbi:unknown [Fusobacterium sp. CAG:439]|nr:unknown [Fusobacterium sp. CAG:439]
MKTKDYSRELCEICGIEAKQFIKDFKTRDRAASFGRKITGLPKFRGNKFAIGSYTDNQSIYQVHWKEFPDFTKPENFVKLEELMLAELAKQRLTVVKWVHYFSDNTLMHEYILITKCGHKIKFKHNGIEVDNWFVERENRTECLILFILRKVLPICGDSLKQAIREQEWLYG